MTGPCITFGLLDPLPHRGLGQSKSRATWPTDRSPRWHNSTISALNSGVNERRRRGFFLPMLSMVGHPSGGEPLMMDVRQSGPGPGSTWTSPALRRSYRARENRGRNKIRITKVSTVSGEPRPVARQLADMCRGSAGGSHPAHALSDVNVRWPVRDQRDGVSGTETAWISHTDGASHVRLRARRS